MSKEEKPKVEDIEKNYPWGKKTATYRVWLVLFTINIIVLSAAFLAYVEIPALLDEKHLETIFEPRSDEPLGIIPLWFLCVAVVIANIVIVYLSQEVGEWLNVQESKCWQKTCIKWCLCCNKWFCVLVWVLKWVTWIITIVATAASFIFQWTCYF